MGPLVVNSNVDYCCTRVLFLQRCYKKKLKKYGFWHIFIIGRISIGEGEPAPLATPMPSMVDKTKTKTGL